MAAVDLARLQADVDAALRIVVAGQKEWEPMMEIGRGAGYRMTPVTLITSEDFARLVLPEHRS